MTGVRSARLWRLGVAALWVTMTGGCSLLHPAATPQSSFYAIDGATGAARVAGSAPPPSSVAAPTLIVSPPHAATGFDSQRIIYVHEAHKLEYYAHSEWVDAPARMIAPLIVVAVEHSGAFRAVVLAPSSAAGDLRLDTEIMRLQHEFDTPPSRVRFTLRAYLVENPTRRVLAWREFDETVAAASEDPYGGVVAANRAVQTVLGQLAIFCRAAAANWHPPAAEAPKRSEGREPGR